MLRFKFRRRPSSSFRLVCQFTSLFLFLLLLKNKFLQSPLLETPSPQYSRPHVRFRPTEARYAGSSLYSTLGLQKQRHGLMGRSLLRYNGGPGTLLEDAAFQSAIAVHENIEIHPLPSTVREKSVSENVSSAIKAPISWADKSNNNATVLTAEGLPCEGVMKHIGFSTSCDFVKANPQCNSGSVIDYTRFFFCTCGKFPVLGYMVLTLWLLVLFYTLGNTAADYFCCSLEKLSELLNCPPTVAGVTLLPLGNGAPDVFASIAAFLGAGVGQVGLNSVLGGGVFVTTVVAGAVSLLVSNSQSTTLDKRSFIRDVSFFLVTIIALTRILWKGSVHLWSALAFLSLYGLYGIAVAASEIIKKKPKRPQWSQIQLLPFTSGPSTLQQEEDDSMYSPLLDPTTLPSTQAGEERKTLPQWRWASNVAIYSQQTFAKRGETARPPLLMGWSEEEGWQHVCSVFVNVLQWPLSLPRRLTIPVVEDDRWSHKYVLASAGLAPLFFALVLDSQDDGTFETRKGVLYTVAALIGLSLAVLAFFTTNPERPPRRFLLLWVMGGFFMSIVWFFVIANELVALLVTFGTLLDVDPSILGLTVLAWGNSMGDLMANIALACNGGDGVQIAMSGCYAGPMFNTLIGIGVSLVLGSWGSRPHAFPIPQDDSIFYTMGFLVISLLWALVMLPLRRMQPSRLLGVGLLMLYISFLAFRLVHALGFVSPSVW